MAKLRDLLLGVGQLKPYTFKHALKAGGVVDVHVMIKPLTKVEIDIARLNAIRTLKDLDKGLREEQSHDDLLDEARTVELLAAALRDPENVAEPWCTPMEIAQTLHPAVIAQIARAYHAHQSECAPQANDLTEDQLDMMIEMIAREASAEPFFSFGFPLQNACIVRMARDLFSARMEKLSRSSASNSPSNATETSANESASSEAESPTTALRLTELEEVIKDLVADGAVSREAHASLTVRVMHLEADRMPLPTHGA